MSLCASFFSDKSAVGNMYSGDTVKILQSLSVITKLEFYSTSLESPSDNAKYSQLKLVLKPTKSKTELICPHCAHNIALFANTWERVHVIYSNCYTMGTFYY